MPIWRACGAQVSRPMSSEDALSLLDQALELSEPLLLACHFDTACWLRAPRSRPRWCVA